MRARNPPASLSSQRSDCPGQGLLLKAACRGACGEAGKDSLEAPGMHGLGGLRGEVRMRGRQSRPVRTALSQCYLPSAHPLHTRAPISWCEPRPPCDRPFSGAGMGGPSTAEPGWQRPPHLPSSLAGWTGRAAPPAPAWRLSWAARPSLLGAGGRPPSVLSGREPRRTAPLSAAPAGTSPLTPSPAARVATGIQSSPPPPALTLGPPFQGGPPSFLHGLRQ